MIELRIQRTGKSYAPSDRWATYDVATERFPDMASAKAWLKAEYGKRKRVPMWRDGKDGGESVKVGYVYGYRAEQQDRSASNGVAYYLAQDWIEFRDVQISTPGGI